MTKVPRIGQKPDPLKDLLEKVQQFTSHLERGEILFADDIAEEIWEQAYLALRNHGYFSGDPRAVKEFKDVFVASAIDVMMKRGRKVTK